MGKSACITRMGAVRNYSTNTIMEKNRARGERGLRIWNFRGIGEIASGFSRGLIKSNVEFSGCDQEKIMWNFQGSWF